MTHPNREAVFICCKYLLTYFNIFVVEISQKLWYLFIGDNNA